MGYGVGKYRLSGDVDEQKRKRAREKNLEFTKYAPYEPSPEIDVLICVNVG